MSETTKQHALHLYREGELAEAQQIARELLHADPDDAQLWLLDGLVCAREKQFTEALGSLNASLQRQRTFQVLLTLGQVYLVTGDQEQAERHLVEAIECRPGAGVPRVTLGNLYANQGRFEPALEIYQWLVENGLADASVYGNMALTLEMLRRDDDARQAATEALKLEQYQPTAHLVLARLNRRTNNEGEFIPQLQQAIAVHQDTVDGASLLGELGHALDRSGEYERAFDAFQSANLIWQKVAQSAPQGTALYLRRIAEMRRQFSAPTPNPSADLAGERLVFFVGFPRSGTTLVEQILKICPGVVTTQEEPLVTNLIEHLTNGKTHSRTYPALLTELYADDLDSLRNRYISELHQATGSSDAKTLYVDKLPLNILEAGFINRLFPAARFLVALRDPRDVCLSCFMQSFRLNSAMLHFLDIEDTARFYAATMGLWNHYKKVLTGLRYLEYRYEDLIEDFDGTSQRILEFLGVEWTPDIRAFHEQAGARVVQTPSFIDVASPLYSRAVGRWQHYARQLIPIEATVRPFVEQLGYAE